MTSLGLATLVSATDAVIQKKSLILERPGTIDLPPSNKRMEDIPKVVKALEDSVLIIKVASEPIKNETKEQNGGFLDILLEAIDGSFFRKYVSR